MSARRLVRLASILALAAAPSGAWQDPVPHAVTSNLDHGQRAVPWDVEGDGDLDLLASYSLADAVYLLVNPGGASSFTPVRVGGSIVAMDALPLYADCDGDRDVAA